VPTVAESGFASYAVDIWYGLVAPAKTPKETVSQLAEWFGTVMQSSEFRAKIVRLGLYRWDATKTSVPISASNTTITVASSVKLTSRQNEPLSLRRGRSGHSLD
jgi:tripartite-type tricarboxylate transporter receptor subunit TctC